MPSEADITEQEGTLKKLDRYLVRATTEGSLWIQMTRRQSLPEWRGSITFFGGDTPGFGLTLWKDGLARAKQHSVYSS